MPIEYSENLYNHVFVSDEADCVRHALREVATRFDITTPVAVAMIARMYGITTEAHPVDLDELAAELNIDFGHHSQSQRV